MFPETLRINTLTLPQLQAELATHNVGLNAHAQQLLTRTVLHAADARPLTLHLQVRTVADLRLTQAATLPTIFAAATAQELALCPQVTVAYLRLAYLQQPASDAPVHAGRAPLGALTVASAPLSPDDEFPKGFYLRMIDGQPWLRGYRCDDTYVWHDDDVFVFCAATPEN